MFITVKRQKLRRLRRALSSLRYDNNNNNKIISNNNISWGGISCKSGYFTVHKTSLVG